MLSSADELREEVRRRYAESARAVTEGSCGCGSGDCCTDEPAAAQAFYDADERGELPDAAVLESLGCGNPVAVADLHEGEVVLDLGSGGGIDAILSARRVGPCIKDRLHPRDLLRCHLGVKAKLPVRRP